MAISDAVTKLPLTTWAALMGINPLHFEQVQLIELQDTYCGQSWFQYEWQDHDRSGREEIARSIAKAEADLEQELGYRLLPSWEADERVQNVRPGYPELVSGGGDVRSMPQTVNTRWKYVQSGGVRATAALGNFPIVFTDTNGDGYFETATVTVTGCTFTNPDELHLFYSGFSDSTREIRPIKVVLNTNTGIAVCTFQRQQVVALPLITQLIGTGAVDGSNDGNFEATLDAVRVYNDPSQAAAFLWEPGGGPPAILPGLPPQPIGTYLTQTGVLIPRNGRLGIMDYQFGTWDLTQTPPTWMAAYPPVWRNADTTRLWYYGGLQGPNSSNVIMDPDWAMTVAIFAASMLDRPLCDCRADFFDQWRSDLSFVAGSGENSAVYRMSPLQESCPWGFRRGAVYAWERAHRQSARVGTGWVAVH